MGTHRKQHGITLIGFLFMLCIIGFFVYAALKLVPAYIEYFGVIKSMKQMQTEAGIETKSVDEIRQELGVKFDLQYVNENHIPKQNIQLIKQGGAASLRVFYDLQIPFIYNVDLLLHFDKTVDLSRGATF